MPAIVKHEGFLPNVESGKVGYNCASFKHGRFSSRAYLFEYSDFSCQRVFMRLCLAATFVAGVLTPLSAHGPSPEESLSASPFWTPERVEQLSQYIPALGGLSEDNLSPEEFVNRPAYKQLYIAGEHAFPCLVELGLTHPDWSVRASSVHLIAQLRTNESCTILASHFLKESHEHVRALIAWGLLQFHGSDRYVEKMFLPLEKNQGGTTVSESKIHPLQQLVEAMYSVRPNLTDEEQSILISDLVWRLGRKTAEQQRRDDPSQRVISEDDDSLYRLADFGEAAYKALVERYWTCSEPWAKENVLGMLRYLRWYVPGLYERDDGYFEVLQDAVQHPDKHVRWEVFLSLDLIDARNRDLYDKLRNDPCEWIRAGVARQEAWEAECPWFKEEQEEKAQEAVSQEQFVEPGREAGLDTEVPWRAQPASAETNTLKPGATSSNSTTGAKPPQRQAIHTSVTLRVVVLGVLAFILLASWLLLRRYKTLHASPSRR